MATMELFFLHCMTLEIKVKYTFAWLFLFLAIHDRLDLGVDSNISKVWDLKQ